jgi:hypothetical protein
VNATLLTAGETTYTYSQANRLTGLAQGTTTFQFNYNGDGVRLRQVLVSVPVV